MLESMPAPDGGTREWLGYKFVMQGDEGQRFVGGVALDITERLRMEEALRERARANSQLASAINSVLSALLPCICHRARSCRLNSLRPPLFARVMP